MIQVVDVRKIISEGKIKAFVDIKYHDLIIKCFTVLEDKKKLFVAFPRKVAKDGRWYDILLPRSEDVKINIENAILEAYKLEV